MAKRNKKLCLTMIVKNEAHCISTCLDSYRDSIDMVAIVDTGSTDNTIEIIEDYLKLHKIAGGVVSKPWAYFAISRNDSIEYAYRLIREYYELPSTGPLLKEELALVVDQWYLIFTDADNRLVNEGEKCFNEEQCKTGDFNTVDLKAKLSEIPDAESYYIYMRVCTTRYIHRSIISLYITGSRGFKYVCHIHEYLSSPGWNPTHQTINDVYCFSGRHGGRSSSLAKSDRDASMLMETIKECRISSEDYDRCIYYLAQCYKDAGENEIAYKYYLKRAKMKTGYHEERYVSYLRCSQIIPYLDIGLSESEKKNIKVGHLLSAFEIIPYRREAIYDLMCHYDDARQFKFVWSAIKDYIVDNNVSRYHLLVDGKLYGAFFDEKAALISYYAGDIKSFVVYNERALKDPSISDTTRSRLVDNRKYYDSEIWK